MSQILYEMYVLMLKNTCCWDFPGGPVVKTPPSKAGGVGRSLVGELRSHMPRSQKTKT